MRSRYSISLALALWLCGLATAQPVRLQEFQAVSERLIHMRVPDSEAAARIRRLQPAERIPVEAVEAILSWGAGPLVRRELNRQRERSTSSPDPLTPVVPPRESPIWAPVIEDGEPAIILETVRLYAQDYADSVPNFLCIRESTFLQERSPMGKWKPKTSVVERLSHVDGTDEHTILAIDGEPVEGDVLFVHGGISVAGEFGNIIRRIFEESTEAKFTWLGSAPSTEGPRARIGFRVETENSSMTVSDGDSEAVIGYTGELLVSPESGQIFRLQLTLDQLPDGNVIRGGTWDIQYGIVKVEEEELLLPVRAVSEAYQPRTFLRNEATYRDYQQYTSDSSIQFDLESPTSSASAP